MDKLTEMKAELARMTEIRDNFNTPMPAIRIKKDMGVLRCMQAWCMGDVSVWVSTLPSERTPRYLTERREDLEVLWKNDELRKVGAGNAEYRKVGIQVALLEARAR